MDYVLNVAKDYSAPINEVSETNSAHLKPGDQVQIYPFAIRDEKIVVRRMQDNKPNGHYMVMSISRLGLTKSQKNQIEKVKMSMEKTDYHSVSARAVVNESCCSDLLSSSNKINPGDRVHVWFYTIEAGVSIEKNNGRFFCPVNSPITVAVEKFDKRGNLSGKICVVDINDLILNLEQQEKIKGILKSGIKDLVKDLDLFDTEKNSVRRHMKVSLSEVFFSEQDIISLDEHDEN